MAQRHKPGSMPQKVYSRKIKPKLALHYKEFMKFAIPYALARLRRPLSKHPAQLSDLLPENATENAKDIAAEAFKKLLSGERQDWDGTLKTLHDAVGSCINSILSAKLKKHENTRTTYIDDAKLDWLYGDSEREDPELEPAEEYANRHSKAKLIKRLLPERGYDTEAKILGSMIISRVFNVDLIAKLTGMSRTQVSNSFVRLASYVQTDEFAIRLTEVFGESVARPVPQEIRDLASDVVRLRFGRK